MQGNIGDAVIVAGKAIKDAEYKVVGDKGSPICSFSLNVGKRKDTTTIFVNCKAWYALAKYSQDIRKGDTVIVIGHTESREYNGKTYTDLTAEWMNIICADYTPSTSTETSPSGKPYPVNVKFEEEPEKGPLPF